MFAVNNYATCWACEDKGKYSVLEMSTSRKNKDSGEYETDFSSKFVRLVGEAHNKAKKYKLDRKDRIKILSCGVETRKTQEGKYYENFVIFDFEVAESNGGASSRGADEPYQGDEDPV